MNNLYDLAREADEKDYSAAAIVLLEKYLPDHPEHSAARYRYAQNLLRVGRISDSEQQLVALSMQPLKKPWLIDLSLGEIERIRGNLSKSEMYLREAMKKNPESTVPYVYLGGILAYQERFAEACSILSDGLKAEGDLDEVYLNLGNNRRALGQYAAARACYVRALEFSSEHYKAAEEALQDLDFLEKSGVEWT
jgi:predicted Zn-dependent protease